jgi:hypothetical protein
MSKAINWEFVDSVTLAAFAAGIISGKDFYAKYKCGEHGPIARSVIRNHSLEHSRELAKRAFNRRKKSGFCDLLPIKS